VSKRENERLKKMVIIDLKPAKSKALGSELHCKRRTPDDPKNRDPLPNRAQNWAVLPKNQENVQHCPRTNKIGLLTAPMRADCSYRRVLYILKSKV